MGHKQGTCCSILTPLKGSRASSMSPAGKKEESHRAFCVAALAGVNGHQHSRLSPPHPICGPLTGGAMYRASWALFKIGAQLTLQVPVPKY